MKKIIVLLGITLLASCSISKKKEVKTTESVVQEVEENFPPPPPPVMQDSRNIETLPEETISDGEIEPIFEVAEKMPEFPGGMEKMMEFIMKNMKYPQEAKVAGVKGKVYVQFVVKEDGTLDDIKVIRGIGSGCDEEARRIVKLMPNWIPGEQRGKPVPVRMILPINFTFR